MAQLILYGLPLGWLTLLLLVRYRSRKVVRIRTRSARALDRISTACRDLGWRAEAVGEEDTSVCADLSWTSSRRTPCLPTRAWNRLGGSRCFEDKRILGEVLSSSVIEESKDGPGGLDRRPRHLECVSIGSPDDFETWWARPNVTKRVWVLKDALANGGCGLWFIDREASSDRDFALQVIRGKSEAGFTLQEYLPGRPLLWQGRKFHFRVGGVVTATGRAYLHRTAFVHPANKDFVDDPIALKDPGVHVTNLCVNLGLNDPSRFVGEIREDLPTDRPNLWPRMLQLWGDVVSTCFKLMKVQRSALDFEYIGLDMIANDEGEVFLIEANCPPALASATGYAHANAMHDEILFDLFRYLVLPPLLTEMDDQATAAVDQHRGGWFACPTTVQQDQLVYTGDYRKAQASCELALMMHLNRLRKNRTKNVL